MTAVTEGSTAVTEGMTAVTEGLTAVAEGMTAVTLWMVVTVGGRRRVQSSKVATYLGATSHTVRTW